MSGDTGFIVSEGDDLTPGPYTVSVTQSFVQFFWLLLSESDSKIISKNLGEELPLGIVQ